MTDRSTTASDRARSIDLRGEELLRFSAPLLLPILVLAVFIVASAAFRPVLSPDETRYLTVSWEMFTRHHFIVPTFNFAPYHHKPPLLFWLIDIYWSIIGVSRWAALGTIFTVSSVSIVLTRRLAQELLPDRRKVADRISWAMLGNAVFVIYSGLILFDLLLTCCVLGALLAFLVAARQPEGSVTLPRVCLAGLSLGLGILAKGPVVLIFVLWPIATYPWWRGERRLLRTSGAWKFFGCALLVAVVPVAAWVAPTLIQTNGDFARSLIVDQTAGRISGTLANAHDRPFWYYLPLLPIFAMPWIFSPYVWRANREPVRCFRQAMVRSWQDSEAFRFLVSWAVTSIITFSVIGGKQPHYIVPILPAAVIASAIIMRNLKLRLVATGAAIVLGLAIAGQAIASLTVFKGYELQPIANLVAAHDGPVAFVGNYQGELGFLGRLTVPLDIVDDEDASSWLSRNPDGMLVDLGLRTDEKPPGRTIFTARSDINRKMAASVNWHQTR